MDKLDQIDLNTIDIDDKFSKLLVCLDQEGERNTKNLEIMENVLKSWDLGECVFLVEEHNRLDQIVDRAGSPPTYGPADCEKVVYAAIDEKFSPPEPGEIPPDEYDNLLIKYYKEKTIREKDGVRLNREYLGYPKGYQGVVFEQSDPPGNVNEVHYFTVSFRIINPESGKLCWIEQERVPLEYLELVEKADVRYERIKKKAVQEYNELYGESVEPSTEPYR